MLSTLLYTFFSRELYTSFLLSVVPPALHASPFALHTILSTFLAFPFCSHTIFPCAACPHLLRIIFAFKNNALVRKLLLRCSAHYLAPAPRASLFAQHTLLLCDAFIPLCAAYFSSLQYIPFSLLCILLSPAVHSFLSVPRTSLRCTAFLRFCSPYFSPCTAFLPLCSPTLRALVFYPSLFSLGGFTLMQKQSWRHLFPVYSRRKEITNR